MKHATIIASVFSILIVSTTSTASLPLFTIDDYQRRAYSPTYINGYGQAAVSVRAVDASSSGPFFIATWRAGQSPLLLAQDDGHSNGNVFGITESGYVSGSVEVQTSENVIRERAAYWRPNGSRVDLPLPIALETPQRFSRAAINPNGTIAGESAILEGNVVSNHVPITWNQNGEPSLVPLPDGVSPDAESSIGTTNLNGYFVQTTKDSNGYRAFRRDSNLQSTELFPPSPMSPWGAGKMNHLNQVIGTGLRSDGSKPGILWDEDAVAIELGRTLNTTQQFTHVVADINNNGFVVGREYAKLVANGPTVTVAVRWSPNGEGFALDDRPNSAAYAQHSAVAINDLGFMVGWSSQHGVLWYPSGDVVDLNDLHNASDEWTIRNCFEITNTGWISGYGTFAPVNSPEYERPFSMLIPFTGTYGLGDANFDESIDFSDLLIVAQNYGLETNGSVDMGDLDLDGTVGFSDLLAVAQNYGSDFSLLPANASSNFLADWNSARAMVPEPSTLMSIMISGLLLNRRRV